MASLAASYLAYQTSKLDSLAFKVALASAKAEVTQVLVDQISPNKCLNSASASASLAASSFNDSQMEILKLSNQEMTLFKDSSEKVEAIYKREAIGLEAPILDN